ncbi:MAG: hypothetical protein KJO11_15780 [Gemmatimonadetes bacterium]|nr:hypothetical protein [Gemmatimonadota bacterium]MBT8402791.1 hypothetical protein [Gemmatimonadota bacterium]
MNDLPTRPRRYDEKEVSRLLERASELQRSRPTAPDPTGLTLAELQEIAAEAGLDPEHLQRAAVELDRPEVAGGGVGASLAGAPTRVLLERTLPVEVSPAVFDQLVPIIQIAADAPGQASQVGRSLTWHSQNPSNPRTLQILVSVQDGHTSIRIDERYGGWAGALFGGVMGGVGGGVGIGVGGALGGILGSTALAIGFPAAILTGSYVLCRSIYKRFVTRRIQLLQELMDRMEAELSAAAETSTHELPPSSST